MKILWFTGTPSLFDRGKHHYHGCGWIDSLETLVRQNKDIELAVSFFHPEASGKIITEEGIYYPVRKVAGKKSPLTTVLNNLAGKIEKDESDLPRFLEVIHDFNPDLIQVFGTESIFAKIQEYTSIPVVIHLQGLINPYLNTYFPPFISRYGFLLSPAYLFRNLTGSSPFFVEKKFSKQATREKEHFKQAKYLMGRTQWDRAVSALLAPKARYFHVGEVLRSPFYVHKKENYKKGDPVQIISTISSTIYKGLDVILKTAQLLDTCPDLSFEWKIAGIKEDDLLLKYFEKTFKISHKQHNVKCLGKLTPEELTKLLTGADVFVHPSYIDNSPNSICEAQIIGLPVISCQVGGISSLINDQVTGVLVPSNGIYEIASVLNDYNNDPEKYFTMAKKAREEALLRHDQRTVTEQLFKTWNEIVGLNTSRNS